MRVTLILSCLFLGLPGLSRAAAPQVAAGTPPAGKFYVVQPDGKSHPQDPVREGVAVSADKRLSGPGQVNRKSATSGPKVHGATGGQERNAASTRATGHSAPAKPARDEFAAYQCEQFGLYYTKDRRCIVPATRRPTTPAPPRRQSPQP